MAINETISHGRKFRKCVDNTPGNKKWLRFSFWTKASDIEFDDGTNAESKLGTYKGVTTNENQTAGFAADITLVKSIKTAFDNAISSLQQTVANLNSLLNSTINRFGGMRFYEDATGKYVVGADSVPKKLGSSEGVEITNADTSSYRVESMRYDIGSGSAGGSSKLKEMNDYIFDIKSVFPDYLSLTADNFYFCTLKSTMTHYLADGVNIGDPRGFESQKIYDPINGTLRIKYVSGRSEETIVRDDRRITSHVTYSIAEFVLLIVTK